MGRAKPWLRAASYLPIYLFCVAPAAFLWQRPVTLTVVYAIASLGFLIWRHTTADLVYFFVPFFLGPAGELFAVQQGAWSYPETRLLPIWLPFAWGIAGLFMKNVSEALSGKHSPETPDNKASKRRLARECAKLDIAAEQSAADEILRGEAEWPEY